MQTKNFCVTCLITQAHIKINNEEPSAGPAPHSSGGRMGGGKGGGAVYMYVCVWGGREDWDRQYY